jgi:L-serine dehydratase
LESLRELYKIGAGPSSSHTMGPQKAARIFKEKHPSARRRRVELYGALALTGKGHLTDWIIKRELGESSCEVVFLPEINFDYHPNGMKFIAYDDAGKQIVEWLVFSVGGGDLKNLNEERVAGNLLYPHGNMADILEHTEKNNQTLLTYILRAEGAEIWDFAMEILAAMFSAVERGVNSFGTLPGALAIKRRAGDIYQQYEKTRDFNTLIFSAALAVSEENAAGGEVVTAPTCGSSGVMPGVLYAYHKHRQYPLPKLAEGLLVGGLVGNLVKRNASISGAEVGCQGEVGTACAMTAAAVSHIEGGTNRQIEYAAEIALEHHLGMTCDPVLGYVQIPCIERNALSARRAVDSAAFALLTDGSHYISLDDVIQSLKETGRDLHPHYRETALGGLAKRKARK